MIVQGRKFVFNVLKLSEPLTNDLGAILSAFDLFTVEMIVVWTKSQLLNVSKTLSDFLQSDYLSVALLLVESRKYLLLPSGYVGKNRCKT